MSTAEPSPQLLDIKTWFGSLGGETLCLIHPYTGERLDTYAPPSVVEQHDELAMGFDYFRRNSDMITVVPYYSRHDDRADLGEPEVFEERIRRSDFFGYESLDDQDNELHQRVARTVLRALDDIEAPQTLDNFLKVWDHFESVAPEVLGRNEFVRRLFRSIVLRPGPSIPIEVRSNGTALEQDLWVVNHALGGTCTKIAELAVSMAITNLVDWVRIALLGRKLEEQTGPTLKGAIEVSTWQGLAHRDASRKVGCLGPRVVEEILLGEVPALVADKWKLLSTGTTTISELRAIGNR